MRSGRRFALVAGLATILVLAGGTGATAYWSAQAQVQATAKTATTGLAQTSAATTLAVTYSDTTRVAAGSLTLQNTGSRAATYSVTLAPSAATPATLPSAIAVQAAPVGSAAACTTTATLSSAQSGTAASFTATGSLAAGASLILCVQTSMTSANITTQAGGSADLSLRAKLEYAASDAWRISGAAVVFTQKVSAAFTPQGTSMVPTCNAASGPWYLDMNFPQNAGQQANTVYRVWFARETTPAARVLYPRSNNEAPNGWDTFVRLYWQDDRTASYLNNPAGGEGNSWIFVQQSVSGGTWSDVAYGKFRMTRESNGPRLYCGWQ